METEFQNATGKSIGEVLRDIEEFLSTPFEIGQKRKIDLCSLLPELNMPAQFSFALLSEAFAQGWDRDAAESFYSRAVSGVMTEAELCAILQAFDNKQSKEFLALKKKYGNRFTLLNGSYWSTCLALGVDAGEIERVMQYLRLFTVTLMEFAYMEDRNPQETYTWIYYESFRAMLEALAAKPEPDPLPVKVCSMGGSVGKREGETYLLSLGVDLKNPNGDRMARGVAIDIALLDQGGKTIAVIKDRVQSIDPDSVYHYGIAKKIRGAAVANFSVTARAESYFKLSTPIMKHMKLTDIAFCQKNGATRLKGRLENHYDVALQSVNLHYQYLSEDNKILGGANLCVLGEMESGGSYELESQIAVSIPRAKKLLYSVDFDALELVKE